MNDESLFIWFCGDGNQALKNLATRIFGRSAIILSNVVGPSEEISIFDHQISYVAASISGIPQVLSLQLLSKTQNPYELDCFCDGYFCVNHISTKL